jgi:hypothetical protein
VRATAPALRAAYGAGLVAAPVRDRAVRRFCRILGVRHLLQAVAAAVRPSPAERLTGVAVDLAHCASAAGLSYAVRRHRRLLRANAAVAAGFALAGIRRAP